MYYITKTYLSVRVFFQNFEFFPILRLHHLSNMPTSFWDKVPVLKNKTECGGLPTFGEDW